jgi:hypothetical protein
LDVEPKPEYEDQGWHPAEHREAHGVLFTLERRSTLHPNVSQLAITLLDTLVEGVDLVLQPSLEQRRVAPGDLALFRL